MGLEDFKFSNDTSSTELIDKSEPDNRISHLIKQLDSSDNTGESEEHYDTKTKAAISLAQHGYYVYVEHTYSDEVDHRADVYAELADDEEGVGYETIICEVGTYTASRAKKAIESSDCILLIPKGSNIADAIVLNDEDLGISPESGLHTSFIEEVSSEAYIDSNGDYFIPKIGNLYVERYRLIASDMLSALNSVKGMDVSDIANSINDESNNNYKLEDIEKVAREIGFLKD